MERTIKVTGTGKVSVKPDLTIINLDFSNVLPTYEEALKASTVDVTVVKDALAKAGIDRDSLKTTNFNVNTHYESYRDEKGNYKSKFDGYEYHQSLRFKFDINNELLGKVLYQLSTIKVDPRFRISYGIKDEEKAKNELLGNAIIDAKKKAEIISKAAGVELDEIIDINYSWIDVEFNSRCYDLQPEMMMCKSTPDATYGIDIEPDDIEKSDNVTLVFKIK